MSRFSGHREWESMYHGWDLADAIKDMGFVRPDGKTLIAQPHLSFDEKDMWTLDHVRGYEIKSPLITLRGMTPEQRDAHIADYQKGFKAHKIGGFKTDDAGACIS